MRGRFLSGDGYAADPNSDFPCSFISRSNHCMEECLYAGQRVSWEGGPRQRKRGSPVGAYALHRSSTPPTIREIAVSFTYSGQVSSQCTTEAPYVRAIVMPRAFDANGVG